MAMTQEMNHEGMNQLQHGLDRISSTLDTALESARYALLHLSAQTARQGACGDRLEELYTKLQKRQEELSQLRAFLQTASDRYLASVEESRLLAAQLEADAASIGFPETGASSFFGKLDAMSHELTDAFGFEANEDGTYSVANVLAALRDPNSPEALATKAHASIEQQLNVLFPLRSLSEEEKQAVVQSTLGKLTTAGSAGRDWANDCIDSVTGWAGERIGDAARWADGMISDIPGIGEVWQNITESDMAQYLFELGMDGLGMICDVGSLFKNAALMNWAEAGLDGYDILNGIYATGGDMSAVFAEGMSYFFEGEDKEYWKNEARKASQLGGLADVLRDEELNELAAVVDLTDAIHGGVKTGMGADKLLTFGTAVKADQATLGEVFEAASGFKTGSDPLDKLDNLKTGLEYADGIRNGDLLETYVGHTMPGKVYKGGKGTLENIREVKQDLEGKKE